MTNDEFRNTWGERITEKESIYRAATPKEEEELRRREARFAPLKAAWGSLKRVFEGSSSASSVQSWDGTIRTIHSRLAEERRVFFNACVEIITLLNQGTVINRQMNREIEMAITVCQLSLVCRFLAARRYITPPDSQTFVNNLYSDACRFGSPRLRDECVRRYWPLNNDDAFKEFIFYSDLARFITGKDEPALETLVIHPATIKRFMTVSWLATASAFGDAETMENLVASLQKQSE